MAKRYSEKEIKVLKANYGKVRIVDFIHLLPGRNKSSIEKKAAALGLKSQTKGSPLFKGNPGNIKPRYGRDHHNYREIGVPYQRGGRMLIKLKDGKRPIGYARYLWEKHNGPVPKGYCIFFKDGDRLNCDLSNLEMISYSERSRRATENCKDIEMRKHRQQMAKMSVSWANLVAMGMV
jgi:hypothetical protein